MGTIIWLGLYVVRGKATVKGWVFGVLWFLLNLDIFARATGVLDLQKVGVLEIKVLESSQPSLNQDKVRVFLLTAVQISWMT